MWFAWTAPSSGLFLFNPCNSASSQFGIIQSIYTGNDLGSLSLAARGLTPSSVFARYGSAAVLNAIAGTTYHIALDGYNGVMADYRLGWGPLAMPTISSFTPAGGTAGQTININLSGANFTPGATVIVGSARPRRQTRLPRDLGHLGRAAQPRRPPWYKGHVITVDWRDIEPVENHFDWSKCDATITETTSKDLYVMLMVSRL